MPTPDSATPEPEYDVLIGEVVGIHGLAGELKVSPCTDFPRRFEQLDSLQVRPRRGPARVVQLQSTRFRPDKGQLLLKLAGVEDRTMAAEFIGATLWIPSSRLLPLEEGCYYEHDILGLRVKTTTGEELGPVTEILRTGSNEVYVTERCLIPAIAEVVLSVDLEAGQIIVEPVPGLLD